MYIMREESDVGEGIGSRRDFAELAAMMRVMRVRAVFVCVEMRYARAIYIYK